MTDDDNYGDQDVYRNMVDAEDEWTAGTTTTKHTSERLTCQAAAKYVAEYVAEHASPDPDVPLLTSNIIRAAIMKATGVNTAGTFITNVKKLALDLISGTVAAGYQKLHTYMVQLAEDNGGTYSVFETNESNEFTRCFFMPGCFKNSVRCVKSVIALDGCHLKGLFSKSGVYLTASVKDGSHCNLLAAIAIVPQEGELNWTWFLKHLKSSSMGFDENATLFASDRDKGLINAIKVVYPMCWHRYCMWHICLNIRSKKIKLSDTDKNLLYRVADATTEDKATKAMREVRETVPRAFLYLEAIPGGMQHWSTWAINQAGFATYGVKTSNGAEQNNAWLGVLLRASNPVSALYGYMMKLMWKFKKRYDQVVGRRPGGLVEAAKSHLNQQLERSREYIAFELDKGARDVRHIGMFTVRHCEVAATKFTHRVHIVDVPERTCTCGYWQDSLLPCCHALAATKTHKWPLVYLNESEQTLYSRTVFPSLPRDLASEELVKPPSALAHSMKRKCGRPKKKRLEYV
ncbi:hypothetical protein AaE_008331 [Aphanomyces astaci]|uniref:SWIM-type domain-containing protein n=1 Tax=Aphanomyces astaci TaxID=112090 RepID=A0A6A5AF66_APHAT|nr:hypothetical protein AaE_008331 [Aphanomyces astaci]